MPANKIQWPKSKAYAHEANSHQCDKTPLILLRNHPAGESPHDGVHPEDEIPSNARTIKLEIWNNNGSIVFGNNKDV